MKRKCQKCQSPLSWSCMKRTRGHPAILKGVISSVQMSHQTRKTKLLRSFQLLFYFGYLIFFHVQEFIRETIGRNWLYWRKHKPGKVRISKILLKYKLDFEERARRQDFIVSCGKRVDLDVLDNPNWTLYCVEKDRAFFVLLPRDINYYSTSRFPFMYMPVHDEALSLAEVHKEEFMALARRFNDRHIPKTVFFTNTARCGSTLLAKMLDRPGDSICYSEPTALCSLSIGLDEGLFTEQETKELLEASISCLRAHVPEGQVCVFKTTCTEAKLVHLTKDIANLKNIFMFRKKGLPSVEKLIRREPFVRMILLNIYNFCPDFGRFISNLTPCSEGGWVRKLRPHSLRGYAAIWYAAPYFHHLKNKALYCHPTIWYHELMEETTKTITQLFNAIDIPLHCVEGAVECKKMDSQKSSPVSREFLRDIPLPDITEADRAMFRRYAKEIQVPREIFDS